MEIRIIDSASTALARIWTDRLVRRLRRDGHAPLLVPPVSPFHHDSLRAALVGAAGRVAVLDWDCWPLCPRWAEGLEAPFARDPRLAVVAAGGGWTRFPWARAGDVVRRTDARFGEREWCPLPDHVAGWCAVLDCDRLRAVRLPPEDLDWSPDGFRVLLDAEGRAAGCVPGDTGCRIPRQLAAAGLRAEFVRVDVPAERRWGCVVWEGERPVLFHHNYGSHFGLDGLYDVMHHLIDRVDVTASAVEFLREQEAV